MPTINEMHHFYQINNSEIDDGLMKQDHNRRQVNQVGGQTEITKQERMVHKNHLKFAKISLDYQQHPLLEELSTDEAANTIIVGFSPHISHQLIEKAESNNQERDDCLVPTEEGIFSAALNRESQMCDNQLFSQMTPALLLQSRKPRHLLYSDACDLQIQNSCIHLQDMSMERTQYMQTQQTRGDDDTCQEEEDV
ncbi:hypothetical protein FGO68_gene3272 [Halteria grandinella]|uniref:Uncharacterized protein n=1 Tax=Halteria grandinella TaxID=5974 RepID=A0A8J8NUK5_HALGN|nr:hypothetical protein FGO68_gene3272 [Halteria grandinella]